MFSFFNELHSPVDSQIYRVIKTLKGSNKMVKSIRVFVGFALILGVAAGTVFAQNYKIKQTTSLMGQDMSSTVYVKGSRKRTESSGMMGMGGDVADVEQCDLKRNLKISDKKKLYFIEPFATDDSTPTPATKPAGPTTTGKMTKGGTVTMTTSVNDTGERKQMFGMTARHIKTSMTSQSSPDACSQTNMNMETDGWYIDLPAFSCPAPMPKNPMAGMNEPKRGCTDRMIVKSTGGGKLGFALELTTTMKSGDGQDFSTTVHTLELTTATLADALFDIPAGYSAANNSQDLYGRPDMSAMMRGTGNNDGDENPTKPSQKMPGMNMGDMPSAKRPGVVRIGVLMPTNNGGDAISTTNMQSFLAQKLTNGNVEGVTVGNEADARAAGCDFILSSDFSKLKQSAAGKIGGMFGKVTNTGVGGNYDAQVDFKLVSLKSGATTLQNKSASKSESNVDRAAEGVLSQEAAAVLASAGRN